MRSKVLVLADLKDCSLLELQLEGATVEDLVLDIQVPALDAF